MREGFANGHFFCFSAARIDTFVTNIRHGLRAAEKQKEDLPTFAHLAEARC
jgi:hypothetical protein